MKIHEHDIGHYLHLMRKGRRFSLAGFSDAEWYCILGQRQGEKTALGQVLDAGHGRLLLDVLRRRQADPRFLVAVPKVLWTLPAFCNGEIDWFLGRENIALEGYERDMVTDDLARQAGLYPLIDHLRRLGVVLVGPEPLRTCSFLRYRAFVPVQTPNLHMAPGGIDDAVARCRAAAPRGGRGVYCVSAGVSAAVIIDRLHDELPGCWFLDCGSIWDAFVGLGGQRQWRAELYADPAAWVAWKRRCLTGE